jgi:hypothetical protein
MKLSSPCIVVIVIVVVVEAMSVLLTGMVVFWNPPSMQRSNVAPQPMATTM